jgi:ribosomal-protein-serine acetyltransferase
MFRRTVEPGIEIKQFEPREAEAVFEVVERNRAYLREWLPWVDRTSSPEDIRNFIRDVAQTQYAANQGPVTGIWVEGAFAGSMGCHPIDWAHRHCSVGYWLDQGRQGRGTITRCCATLLDHLFHELGLHRVTIQCATGNLRSCAIPQRLGFTREGVAREAEWVNDRWVDLVVWSMLEDEWRRLK